MERIEKENDASLWTLRQLFEAGAKGEDCPVALPDTLLYENGYPSKWMRLSEETGKMEFNAVDPNDPREMLNAVLNMHSRYRKCLAWYKTGECEELAVSQLFHVFSSPEWQNQIECIQGFDSASSLQYIEVKSDSVEKVEIASLNEEDYDVQISPQESVQQLLILLNSVSARKVDKIVCIVEVAAYNKKRENAIIGGLLADNELEENLRIRDRRKLKKEKGALLKEIRDEDLKGIHLCWLKFVDKVEFREKRDSSGLIGRTSSTHLSNSLSSSLSRSTTQSLNAEPGIDVEFDSYYRVFSGTTRHLIDFVLVSDPLESNFKQLEEFSRACAVNGLRIILVSLIKLDTEDEKLPVESVTNAMLSYWLEKLLYLLKVGSSNSNKGNGKKRPLVLAGVGVGANVIMHAAAFRKFANLQALISINGFGFVDRTLGRFASKLLSTKDIAPHMSRLLSGLRNNFMDLRQGLGLVQVPCVVVQATLDECVLPLHAEAIVNARGAPKTISSTLSECLRSQGSLKSHIVWLKGYHNLFSDRGEFLKALFEQAFSVLRVVNYGAIEKVHQDQSAEEVKKSEPNEDATEIVSVAANEHSTAKTSPTNRNQAGHIKRRDGNTKSLMLEENEESIDDKKRKKRESELEQLKRHHQMIEEEKQRKRADFLRKKPTEDEERSVMMDEDSTSKELRRMLREEQRWEAQQLVVKERLSQLSEARKKEADRVKLLTEMDEKNKHMHERDDQDQLALFGDEDIDLLTASSNILGSSISGASKIRLDFLKLVQRQAVAIQKSNQISQVIKETEKERDSHLRKLSELDRAIAILRGTANLKNPNAASRKRQREAQEAKEQIDEVVAARDDISTLLNTLATKLKELYHEIGKINSSVQSDHVIITRKAGEMEDMLSKLSDLQTSLEKEDVTTKAERKAGLERQNDMSALLEKVRSRMVEIHEEVTRCSIIRSKYCDSSIWQAGVRQRIRTEDLTRYLSRESEALNERIDLIEDELETQIDLVKNAESRIAILQRDQASVSAQLKLIGGALELFKSGEIRRRADSHFANPKNALQVEDMRPNEEGYGLGPRVGKESMLLGGYSLARQTRLKAHALRSQEEREWVALDMVVNRLIPYYPRDDVQKYRHYRDAELSELVLDCIFELPQEINLALPFLRNQAQVRAYQLIQKYSFGNSTEAIAEQDRLDAARRRMDAGLRSFRLFQSIEHFKLSMQEEGKDERSVDKSSILLIEPKWTTVYTVGKQTLQSREGRVHTFFIPPESCIKQLAVHLTYEGGFDERGYIIGRLSAALYFEESESIGYLSKSHDLRLCTKESLGRFTLVHDPFESGVPILSGKYQVVVGAASLTRYSIVVMAEHCKPLLQAEDEAKQEGLDLSDRLKSIDEDSENLTVSLYLARRKVKLIEASVREAERQCESLELEIARIAHFLEKKRAYEEKGMEMDEEDEGQLQDCNNLQLVKREAEFDKWVRLAASRRNELNDTRAGAEDMARLKRNREEEKEEKQAKLQELLKNGLLSQEDIQEKEQQRNDIKKQLEIAQAKQREDRQNSILRNQINVSSCWKAVSEHIFTDKSAKPTTTKALSSSTRGGGAPCSREELLAIMCSKEGALEGPKAVALRELMLQNSPGNVTERITNPLLKEPRMNRNPKLVFETKVEVIERDIDQRCRNVLAELERATASKAAFLDSSILHGAKQRFPAKILRKELNRELDRLLLLQVKEQERFIIQEWRNGLKAVGDSRHKRKRSQPMEGEDIGGDDVIFSDSDESDDDIIELSEAALDERTKEEKALDETLLGLEKDKEKTGAFCRACQVAPCQWKPPVDVVALQERISELRSELESLKLMDETVRFIECSVVKSAKNGGRTRLVRTDVIQEISLELKALERKERLLIVDEELHRAYANKEDFMETKALHGYKQVQWTKNVITALELERSKIIGKEVVYDLMDGILDFMLDGWIFGEREATSTEKNLSKEIEKKIESNETLETRKTPGEKWIHISKGLNDRHRRKKAVELKQDVSHQLGETENNLKFGLFTLTMMYFRAMSLLRKSRFEGPKSAIKKRIENETASAERQRLEKTKARRQARQRAMDRANGMASAGAKKRADKLEVRRLDDQARLRKHLRKVKAENKAAVHIQKLFRGHLGRHAARKWAIIRLEEIAEQNLRFAAAVAIQRVFRGYHGRKVAEDKRAELAEFIAQLRADEAKEEEEEYWRRHPFKRFMRKAKAAFVRAPPELLESDENLLTPAPAKNF